MKARDVILAILIIAFGLSIKYAREIKNGIESIFRGGETFEFEEEILLDGKDEIQIEGESLNIIVEGWEGDKIVGKLIKSVHSYSKEKAEEFAREIKIEKEIGKNLLKLKIVSPREFEYSFFFKFFWYKFSPDITLNLKVPFKSSIKVFSEHSDIEISGIKNFSEINDTHGDIKIKDCEGNFSIKNSHGDIEIINLNGDLKISSPHSSINIENALNAEIEAGYEDISIKNLKNLKLITKHSSVEISEIKGEIYIENSHSGVTIKDSSLKGKIQGEHLEINGEGISAEELQITNSYEPIFLKNFSGNAKICSKHNEIEIDVMKGSNVEIECEYSDVTVNLDKNWKGKIFSESFHGEIETNGFVEGVKIGETGARKKIEANLGGENFLSIKTTYGNIFLNRGKD